MSLLKILCRKRLTSLLVALAVAITTTTCKSSAAATTAHTCKSPAAVVDRNPSLSYYHKLIGRIFPDLKSDGSASRSIVVHHIRSDYDPVALSGNMNVRLEGAYLVKNGSRMDRVLLLPVSNAHGRQGAMGDTTLLALFQRTPHLKLLDVVDICMDRESGLWLSPPVLPGRTHDALVACNSHLNAGEEFVDLKLVEIVHNKFTLSHANLPLSCSTMSGKGSIQEFPSFVCRKNAGATRVTFAMQVRGKKLDEDTQAILESKSRRFKTELIERSGRWRCTSCSSMSKSMATMEKHFGYSND